jgi:protein import protein ZIM17
VKKGDNSHYVISFVCKKCETRTSKMFTKRAYHHGIVLVKCEGCQNFHLIADNLGWFEDDSINVEQILSKRNEEYKKLKVDGVFQLENKATETEQVKH